MFYCWSAKQPSSRASLGAYFSGLYQIGEVYARLVTVMGAFRRILRVLFCTSAAMRMWIGETSSLVVGLLRLGRGRLLRATPLVFFV